MAGYITKGGNRNSTRKGATVSRRLKAAGFNISPAARRGNYDGLFVRQLVESVTVHVDLGAQDSNESAANALLKTVSCWPEVAGLRTDTMDSGQILIRFDLNV